MHAARARWRMPAVSLVLAVTIAGCDAPRPAARTGTTTVEVSQAVCGQGWRHPRGGTQEFQVRNVGTYTTEVRLVDPATGAVYAELEGLAAGTARPLRVRLGRGRYAFRCLPEDTEALTGHTVTITDGPVRGAPAVIPVSAQDLRGPVTSYRAYVLRSLRPLRRDVAALHTAIRSGDRAVARRAWLPAHLDYERLGAAYGTFGELADAIDGLPAGLPDGVRDTHFTGLRRLEYGLWHDAPMRSLQSVSGRLVDDVRTLTTNFGRARIDPNDLPRRAHEILEQTLEFTLTDRADQGSGTSLATARANLDGTRAVLDALRPVLAGRYPGLPGVDDWLHRVARLLDAQRRNGRWPTLGSLSSAARRRIDGAVGELLERLAPIAALGEVRRSR